MATVVVKTHHYVSRLNNELKAFYACRVKRCFEVAKLHFQTDAAKCRQLKMAAVGWLGFLRRKLPLCYASRVQNGMEVGHIAK